jgi:hypothetical protein
MAIITTYVCDVSGVQGQSVDFVKVSITVNKALHTGDFLCKSVTEKLIHKDVALKLNLIWAKKDEPHTPEPTLESKLMVLLKDFVTDIAYEAGAEAASNYNRGG